MPHSLYVVVIGIMTSTESPPFVLNIHHGNFVILYVFHRFACISLLLIVNYVL